VDVRRQARQYVLHRLFDRTQLHHLKPPARSVDRGRPRLTGNYFRGKAIKKKKSQISR
jgi:hypothetical protein